MRTFGTAALALAALSTPTLADDEKETGWFNTTNLSYVLTSGNTDTDALGAKNLLRRVWDNAAFNFRAEAVHASSRPQSTAAAGTPPVEVEEPRETTAERYLLEPSYERNITDRFFWNAGVTWDRNRPAGIDERYQGWAGVGNIWIDNDRRRFSTNYNATYTDRTDVVDTGREDSFAGLRTGWSYLDNINDSVVFTNDLVANMNLDETDDWWGDMVSALSVAMSKRMALRVSLQWLYQNEPAFRELAIVGGGGTTITVENDELDQIFNTSLVINW